MIKKLYIHRHKKKHTYTCKNIEQTCLATCIHTQAQKMVNSRCQARTNWRQEIEINLFYSLTWNTLSDSQDFSEPNEWWVQLKAGHTNRTTNHGTHTHTQKSRSNMEHKHSHFTHTATLPWNTHFSTLRSHPYPECTLAAVTHGILIITQKLLKFHRTWKCVFVGV